MTRVAFVLAVGVTACGAASETRAWPAVEDAANAMMPLLQEYAEYSGEREPFMATTWENNVSFPGEPIPRPLLERLTSELGMPTAEPSESRDPNRAILLLTEPFVAGGDSVGFASTWFMPEGDSWHGLEVLFWYQCDRSGCDRLSMGPVQVLN